MPSNLDCSSFDIQPCLWIFYFQIFFLWAQYAHSIFFNPMSKKFYNVSLKLCMANCIHSFLALWVRKLRRKLNKWKRKFVDFNRWFGCSHLKVVKKFHLIWGFKHLQFEPDALHGLDVRHLFKVYSDLKNNLIIYLSWEMEKGDIST